MKLPEAGDELASHIDNLVAKKILGTSHGVIKNLDAQRWHHHIFSADWRANVRDVIMRTARRQAMDQCIGEDGDGLLDPGFHASVVRRSKRYPFHVVLARTVD